jgi:hypothetical protein
MNKVDQLEHWKPGEANFFPHMKIQRAPDPGTCASLSHEFWNEKCRAMGIENMNEVIQLFDD